jgi:NAD(P)-dependent dehydrogenase (short-subunit alcohol dehydrogenase family)
MPLDDFDVRGRVALVTGAGRGIGAGVARVLAEAGCEVVVNARTPQYVEPLVAGIAADTGAPARALIADMTDPAEVDRAVRAVIAESGRLDILVNAVGDAIPRPLVPLPDRPGAGAEGLTDDDFELTLGLNLKAAVLACRAAGSHMLERRSGVVVNIGSATAFRGGAGLTIYTAGKAGLRGFTQALALEWAPYGVRVNTIAAGSFPDPVTAGDEGYRRAIERAKERIPLQRIGATREVGLLALYLASPAAAYLTGQTIVLDGGATL